MRNASEVVWMDIDDVHPYENNPRNNDEAVDKVAASIEQFGFQNPIIVDRDHVIIAGHTRWKAAKKLGWKQVRVIVSDLTGEDARGYRLADNKTGEFATWDEELLDVELDIGMDDDDTELIPPEDPRTKPGDMYRLGDHILRCGDSTSPDDFGMLMGGEVADITITSPPYGGGEGLARVRNHIVAGGGHDMKVESIYETHDDDPDGWDSLMRSFFKLSQEHSMAQFVNVMPIAENKAALMRFVADNADHLTDIIVWNKHNCPPQIAPNVLNNGYEFVFAFDSEKSSRRMRFGDFHGDMSNYIETDREVNEYADVHKAVYSKEFVRRILDINAKAESVLDPFGGTGTTLMVCEERGIRCFTMEKDPAYCDLIVDRWESETGKVAVKL